MMDDAVLAAYGFTKPQAVRAIAKPMRKRTAAEQSLIEALVATSRKIDQ